MVALPRTCEHCGSSMYHYGGCHCQSATAGWVRAEREKLLERLATLDKIEADANSQQRVEERAAKWKAHFKAEAP